jgi:hypothetical protein
MAFLAYDPANSTEHVDAFILVPDKDQRSVGQGEVATVKRLVSLIPEGTEQFPPSSADYPCIDSKLLTGSVVYTDSYRRPVFSIAGVPFFRRYNDDWSALVMQGDITNGNVSWKTGGVTRAAVTRLVKLIEATGIDKVTQDQVLKALRD